MDKNEIKNDGQKEIANYREAVSGEQELLIQ